MATIIGFVPPCFFGGFQMLRILEQHGGGPHHRQIDSPIKTTGIAGQMGQTGFGVH